MQTRLSTANPFLKMSIDGRNNLFIWDVLIWEVSGECLWTWAAGGNVGRCNNLCVWKVFIMCVLGHIRALDGRESCSVKTRLHSSLCLLPHSCV